MIVPHEYIQLTDGSLLSVHTIFGDRDVIVGDIAFMPSRLGGYSYREGTFAKPYIDEGLGRRVTAPGVVRIRSALQRLPIAQYFPMKSVVTTDEISRVITGPEMSERLQASGFFSRFQMVAEWALTQAGFAKDNFLIYPTGSAGLGSPTEPHDYDVVLRGSRNSLASLVSSLQALTLERPQIRLFEYRRSWRLRLLTPHGIFCPFFASNDADESEFSWMNNGNFVGERDVELRGVVIDSLSSALTPSVFDVTSLDGEEIRVVDFDMRSRGDLACGELGLFRGTLVLAADRKLLFPHASVGLTNLNPPWDAFYGSER